MSIRTRINESPSLRKLFRNRGAMIAMSIISLYLLLFVWIITMQFASWVGKATNSFDLRERPVMGALLPERTLERVGASNQPGFGLMAEPAKRTEHVKFYFEQVARIFNEIDQSSTALNGSDDSEARTMDEILNASRLAERRVADLAEEDRAMQEGLLQRRRGVQRDRAVAQPKRVLGPSKTIGSTPRPLGRASQRREDFVAR